MYDVQWDRIICLIAGWWLHKLVLWERKRGDDETQN